MPVLTAAIAYYFLRDLPRQYVSTAHIATGFTTDEGIQLDDFRYNSREADVKFQNLLTIFKSPSVLNLLGYRLMVHDLTEPKPFKDLRRDPEFRKHYTEQELQSAVDVFRNKLENFELLQATDSQEVPMLNLLKFYGYDYNSLLNSINFSRIDFSDFIAINYTSPDPHLSAYAVNNFIEEFQRYNQSMSNLQSGKSLQFYADLVEQKRKYLDEKTQSLKDYKANSNLFDAWTESQARLNQISSLETKIQEEQRIASSARLTAAELGRRIRALQNTTGGSGNAQDIVRLEAVRDRLNSEALTAKGARANVINDSLSTIRRQLGIAYQQADYGGTNNTEKIEELEAERDQAQIDQQIANSNIETLRGQLDRLESGKGDLAEKSSMIDNLSREVELAAQEYTDAQDRYNNAKTVSLAGGNNIRTVMAGQPPMQPEPSKKLILTALAAIVSFGISFGLIVGVFFLDSSIKTPANLHRMVKMPVIGALNHIAVTKLDLYELFHREHKEADLETFKQSLRKLRYEIEESGKQSFLFTSTQNGEGKSFIVLTLAYSMSLLQKKILIIDTNFKHNTLTTTLMVNPQKDRLLNEYSANGKLLLAEASAMEQEDEADPVDAESDFTGTNSQDKQPEGRPSKPKSRSFISPTHHTNIDIIGSHVTIASPAEILSNRSFAILIEELKHHYDYIFLEGAALNDYPDSKELTRFVDGVITVFSASSTLKQADHDSINFIKSLNGKTNGAIVNQIAADDMKS